MIIYFLSMSGAVHTCNNRLHMLQSIQYCYELYGPEKTSEKLTSAEDVPPLRVGLWNKFACAKSSMSFFTCGVSITAIAAEYDLLRNFFIEEMLLWEITRPLKFAEIKEAMLMVDADSDAVREKLKRDFLFSSYLACVIEQCLSEVIEMPVRTWILLLGEIAVGALCTRLKVGAPNTGELAFFLFVMLLGLTITAVLIVAWRRRDIYDAQRKRDNEKEEKVETGHRKSVSCLVNCGRKYNLEEFYLVIWEFFRFNATYVISWTIMDLSFGWQTYTTTQTVLLCLSLFFDLFLLVWSGVVDAYLVMALPPYVDDVNLAFLKMVLQQHFLAFPSPASLIGDTSSCPMRVAPGGPPPLILGQNKKEHDLERDGLLDAAVVGASSVVLPHAVEQ